MVIACVLFFISWPLQIEGTSMENTLYDGDRVLMSRVWSFLSKPSRGDIIVCIIEDSGQMKNIVKRVIALPNEHIFIKQGNVYINDVLMDEPYADYDEGDDREYDLVLQENEYFIMGDNRNVSNDSRNMGPITADKIVGKILIRFFPFNKVGLLGLLSSYI